MDTDGPLLIWGAGGHGKVVADIARALGWRNISFLDNSTCRRRVMSFSVLQPGAPGMGIEASFVVAIGDNRTRARCFYEGMQKGWRPVSLAHPTAVISRYAEIGQGTVVMPFAVVNACASVGVNCIVNTASVIEHDCQVGDHVHIAPSATLAGGVVVGTLAQISIGACVLPGKRVGAAALVGAGALVRQDVEDDTTVIGLPARVLREHHPSNE